MKTLNQHSQLVERYLEFLDRHAEYSEQTRYHPDFIHEASILLERFRGNNDNLDSIDQLLNILRESILQPAVGWDTPSNIQATTDRLATRSLQTMDWIAYATQQLFAEIEQLHDDIQQDGSIEVPKKWQMLYGFFCDLNESGKAFLRNGIRLLDISDEMFTDYLDKEPTLASPSSKNLIMNVMIELLNALDLTELAEIGFFKGHGLPEEYQEAIADIRRNYLLNQQHEQFETQSEHVNSAITRLKQAFSTLTGIGNTNLSPEERLLASMHAENDIDASQAADLP